MASLSILLNQLELQIPLEDRPIRLEDVNKLDTLCKELTPSERALLLEARSILQLDCDTFHDFLASNSLYMWNTQYGKAIRSQYIDPLLQFNQCQDMPLLKQLKDPFWKQSQSPTGFIYEFTEGVKVDPYTCVLCNTTKQVVFETTPLQIKICTCCKNRLALVQSLLGYIKKARIDFRVDSKTHLIFWTKIQRILVKAKKCLCN